MSSTRMVRMTWVPVVALAFGALASSCRLPYGPPPTAEELKQFPLEQKLPGHPPAGGVRYWTTPFRKLPLRGCYVSVLTHVKEDGRREYEMWQNTWGDGGVTDRCMIVHRGASLSQMRADGPAFDGTLITDTPDPKHPEKLSALRGYTRPFMLQDADYGHVLMTCVCPDYQPGSVPLLPAILVSKTGTTGTFQYLGKIKGDPAVEASKRTIWSDGGSLLRLKDGRWRMYLNGFGQVLAALESDTLEGEWKFVRDGGAIRELLPDFPKAPNRGGCFPTVLRVADDNWHLWITDTWVPQCIWHFWSLDGLSWTPYGQQPEITRVAFGGRCIKCLRAYVDPETGEIVGLLSVWNSVKPGEEGWVLYESRMPSAKAQL